MEKKAVKYQIDLKTQKITDAAYKLQGTDLNSFKIHTHEGFEIMQIWSEEGHIIIEDKVYPFKKGCIYIINAMESHSANPSTDKLYVRSKVTFSPVYIQNILQQMNDLHLLDPFINKRPDFENVILTDENTRKEFDRLFFLITEELARKSSAYSTIVDCYLIEMLVLIYRCYEGSIGVSPRDLPSSQKYIADMLSYVNNHLTEDIDIDRMSQELHISKYYMCHLFKKLTHYTIMQYVVEKRILLAKKYLHLSDKSVSQIASEVGFSSFSLFSRTFKKITGFKPLEFRKQQH
jgi:AraC-like DNA-binding protein